MDGQLVVPNLRGRGLATSIAFDYSAMSDDIASEAKSVIADTFDLHEKQIVAMIAVGERLIEIKRQLDHGLFQRWLEQAFPLGARTALRYMQAAAAFGGSKPTPVSVLPPSMVYALAAPSTPEPVRRHVIEQLEAGEKVDPAEVRFAIRDAKAQEREAAKAEKMKPAQKRQHRRKERDRKKEDEEWALKREASRAAAREAAAMIEKALGGDLPLLIEKLREADLFEFRKYLAG